VWDENKLTGMDNNINQTFAKNRKEANSMFIATIERVRENCGRNIDQDHVHVVAGLRLIGKYATLADFVSAEPTHPWNNIQFNEYLVELTEAEHNTLNADGLFHDGRGNLPKWQQQAGNTGSTKNFGNYADPTNSGSTFTVDVQLDDVRYIFKVYDDDPVAVPAANHIGFEEFDQSTGQEITRYLRLQNQNEVNINTNLANQRTHIGGKLMDFDFGSSHIPALSAGITSFRVSIDQTGKIIFGSNHRYRFVGPDGEEDYRAEIFGKVLTPSK